MHWQFEGTVDRVTAFQLVGYELSLASEYGSIQHYSYSISLSPNKVDVMTGKRREHQEYTLSAPMSLERVGSSKFEGPEAVQQRCERASHEETPGLSHIWLTRVRDPRRTELCTYQLAMAELHSE